jgi:hypothetical protein
MPKKDYHERGYVPPSRADTNMLAAHLSTNIVDTFKTVAAAQNMTVTAAVEEAARDFIAKHQPKRRQPAPPRPRR